jgi:hypothetical protein
MTSGNGREREFLPADVPADLLPADDAVVDGPSGGSDLLPADDSGTSPSDRSGPSRPGASPAGGPSPFPSEDLFQFLQLTRDANEEVIRKAHERKLIDANRHVASPMPERAEEGRRWRLLLDHVHSWLLSGVERRRAYVDHLMGLQHAKHEEERNEFRAEVRYMLRDLVLDSNEEEDLLERDAPRFALSREEAVAIIEQELSASGSKRRADLQREQQERFDRLLVQMETRQEVGSEELQDIVLAGLEAGLTRDESRERVDGIVRRAGVRIRTAVALVPLVGIKDPETQRAPTSLVQMHRAVLADFRAGLTLMKEGRLGFWFEQNQANGTVTEQQAGAAEKAMRLQDDDPVLGLLALLWSTGHKTLYLRSAEERGSRRFSEAIASMDDLLRACDGHGSRLSRVLFSRELEVWLATVAMDAELAKAAAQLRMEFEGEKDQRRVVAAQEFLWRAGETRLRLGAVAVESVEDFAAKSVASVAAEEFRKSLESGAVGRWLGRVAGRPDLVQALQRAQQEPAALRAPAALHVLGATALDLGTKLVRLPEDLLHLVPRDWASLGEAVDSGRVRVWLQHGHGWGQAAEEVEALAEQYGGGRAVQELLWRAGDRRLRLVTEEGDEFLDLEKPEDLVRAYSGAHGEAVAACHADGRLGAWLEQFHGGHRAAAQAREGAVPEQLTVLAILWASGWKVLPAEETSGPAGVEDLIAWVDAEGIGPGGARHDALRMAASSRMLDFWLRLAHGRDAVADDVAKVDLDDRDAAEAILLALGAEAPSLQVSPSEVDLGRVQEGGARSFALILSATGSRGYVFGRVVPNDFRLELDGETGFFRVAPGARAEVTLRVDVPTGPQSGWEGVGVKVRTGIGEQTLFVPVAVATGFPARLVGRSVAKYALLGMLIGAVAMGIVRLWLHFTTTSPLGLRHLADLRVTFTRTPFGWELLVGLLPSVVLAAAILAWRRGWRKRRDD